VEFCPPETGADSLPASMSGITACHRLINLTTAFSLVGTFKIKQNPKTYEMSGICFAIKIA
jgi:hypothetical protein